MSSKPRDLGMTPLDDLFSTGESRAEAQLEKVVMLNPADISDFPNHPFKVKQDEAMAEMADSVKQYGVLVPALVRPKADGGYEMVAGHRRKCAATLARITEMPCIVRKLTDDEATIIMVDSGKIAFRPAVELSYLSKEQQQSLYDTMECEDCTPSLAQAIKMKEFSRDGKLTEEVILSMMQEEKPNQREKPAFRDERITRLIPKSIPRGQETDFVIRALEFYNRHLQRRRDQER